MQLFYTKVLSEILCLIIFTFQRDSCDFIRNHNCPKFFQKREKVEG